MKIQATHKSNYDDSITRPKMLFIGVYDEEQLSGLAKEYDDFLGGAIQARIDSQDFKPSLGNTFTHFDATGAIMSERLVLVGLGKKDKLTVKHFVKIGKTIGNELKGREFQEVVVRIAEDLGEHLVGEYEFVAELVLALRGVEYSFNDFKSKKDAVQFPEVVTVIVPEHFEDGDEAIMTNEALAAGIKFTKDLGNTPANVCTPTWLGEQARDLERKDSKRVRVDVFSKHTIEQLGMGSFLAVAQGSVEEPKFIKIQYNGAADHSSQPLVLVGKGITFDTGGISIKPASTMDEMQYDMLGAATVLGVIKACSELGIHQNIVGLIPTCENAVSGNAVKPGDIVTSMSGKTIEILNTDAEGRLILCDALTYAQEQLPVKPEVVIDIATLTGAICVALGSTHTGMFTNDDKLADSLTLAGSYTNDTVWRMPIDDDYDDTLKSAFADVANIGGRDGGSSSAACFLKRFVNDGTRWAHLDIAGTASNGGRSKHATGRPVAMLFQYILDTQEYDD